MEAVGPRSCLAASDRAQQMPATSGFSSPRTYAIAFERRSRRAKTGAGSPASSANFSPSTSGSTLAAQAARLSSCVTT